MSGSTSPTVPIITDLIDGETVQAIAGETWSALLGADEVLVPLPAELSEDTLSAWVEIRGPWTGVVVLACDRSTAEQLCRTLMREFSSEPLGAEDVADALGELANVVGGNVKALLPTPSLLGLPAVGPRPPSASPADTCRVELRWRDRPITVSVQGELQGVPVPRGREELA